MQDLSMTWNKKHSSKQDILTTNTLRKDFFAAATFTGSCGVSFQIEFYTILCSGLLCISREKKARYWLWEEN